MQSYFSKLLLPCIVPILFSGCGGGDSASSTSTQTGASVTSFQTLFTLVNKFPNKTGIIIDAHGVQGLRISCNSVSTHSEKDGLFTCNTLPLNIYLGNFKIGTISQISQDKIIYTQDIIGVSRAATMHPDVTKLSMIFQSLDEDADLTNGITITQSSINILDNELAKFTDLQHMTLQDTSTIIDNVITARKESDPNVKLQKVSQIQAQINLTEALANTPVATS